MREALLESATAGALLIVVGTFAVLLATHRALLAADVAPAPTAATTGDRPG